MRDCSPGFEARLVAQRNGADLCYAVHADGLVLLATPSGREAASDLILRLLQHGATCVAREEYVIIKKKTLSKDEKKDLKSLLDVCTAFGVSFADYNSKASDSAPKINLNLTRSRRWRRGDAASLQRRRCSRQRAHTPREGVIVTASFRAGRRECRRHDLRPRPLGSFARVDHRRRLGPGAVGKTGSSVPTSTLRRLVRNAAVGRADRVRIGVGTKGR